MVRIHIYLYILYILIYIVYIDRYVFAPSYITQLSKFFQYFITQSVIKYIYIYTPRYPTREHCIENLANAYFFGRGRKSSETV